MTVKHLGLYYVTRICLRVSFIAPSYLTCSVWLRETSARVWIISLNTVFALACQNPPVKHHNPALTSSAKIINWTCLFASYSSDFFFFFISQTESFQRLKSLGFFEESSRASVAHIRGVDPRSISTIKSITVRAYAVVSLLRMRRPCSWFSHIPEALRALQAQWQSSDVARIDLSSRQGD